MYRKSSSFIKSSQIVYRFVYCAMTYSVVKYRLCLAAYSRKEGKVQENYMNIIEKIFGTHSERELKSVYAIADKIESYRPQMQALSDEELRGKTKEYKDLFNKELVFVFIKVVENQKNIDKIGRIETYRQCYTFRDCNNRIIG